MRKLTSLLISTYNWPEALELVMESILLQKILPDEVVIADDGSRQETASLIEKYKAIFPIPLKHVWHTDDGFRKTIIMNKAIHSASGNYIIQIDGDILLHPEFVNDHIKEATYGYFIKGSRGKLSEELTQELIKSKQAKISLLSKGVGSRINSTRLPVLSPLFYGDPVKTNDLRGCNFAFWKSDFIAVNGYNNDLTGWGHEDIELAARLVNYGIKRKQLKMTAICFHLFHKLNSRDQENSNYKAYLDAINFKTKTCNNGYLESLL
ncbi:MAG: glycosyltransferase family 2 protein [Sphingobacteriaceae bacterium]|nr:glycosyltransferase family 2 protein [Sphingobacteriaceae bacterium]